MKTNSRGTYKFSVNIKKGMRDFLFVENPNNHDIVVKIMDVDDLRYPEVVKVNRFSFKIISFADCCFTEDFFINIYDNNVLVESCIVEAET